MSVGISIEKVKTSANRYFKSVLMIYDEYITYTYAYLCAYTRIREASGRVLINTTRIGFEGLWTLKHLEEIALAFGS